MTYIEPGTRRIMDRAVLRDKYGNEYTGEQLMLALLLKTKQKRNPAAEKEIALLLDDPNYKS